VADPDSDGLGVGLQYFPLATPDVPAECASDADCGTAGGPCLTKACTPRGPNDFGFVLQGCQEDVHCPLFSTCVDLGVCEVDDTYICFGPGPGVCEDLGACVALPGSCAQWASCDPMAYAEPAVPIATLPDNGMAITDSLTGEMPIGTTPTIAALAGALNHSAAHGRANPERRVITVLATDGLPTQCVIDIDQVASIAAEGQTLLPSIQTYVIGVFASIEFDAQENLDKLASAGGSDQAFIVDPDEDVAEQFLGALDEIRGGVLQCEYQIPEAPSGVRLDYNRVNVTLTEPEAVYDLLYVGDESNCDQAARAWHYDVSPEEGTPTTIRVCEQTCGTLMDSSEGRVDIRLGCKTITPD